MSRPPTWSPRWATAFSAWCGAALAAGVPASGPTAHRPSPHPQSHISADPDLATLWQNPVQQILYFVRLLGALAASGLRGTALRRSTGPSSALTLFRPFPAASPCRLQSPWCSTSSTFAPEPSSETRRCTTATSGSPSTAGAQGAAPVAGTLPSREGEGGGMYKEPGRLCCPRLRTEGERGRPARGVPAPAPAAVAAAT